MIIRQLKRKEIPSLWTIDRREVIDRIYHHRDGTLVLEDEHYDMQGWPPGEADHYTPLLLDCIDRGGFFWGAFDGKVLAGAAVLESRFIGSRKDTLQLVFLHVGRDYRKQGLGKTLFDRAAQKARDLGARALYVSATPSENTVGFYFRRGCELAQEVDPDLFALEPDDIHLICPLD